MGIKKHRSKHGLLKRDSASITFGKNGDTREQFEEFDKFVQEHPGDLFTVLDDYIEEAKIEIADKVFKKLNDMIFEMVCEEMGKRHVFQSQNYLTEAGMDEFEDQFFEFYHEHHGDILAQIQNKLDVDEVLDASH